MTRRWPSALAVAALALAGLAASGCGGTEKDKYIDDYRPLNDRLLKIGEAITKAPLQAGSDSNAKLARRFRELASDLENVNKDIAALHTPGELADESMALTGEIAVVVRDLGNISDAAKRGDKNAAAAATVALADDEVKVNEAQNKLAKATGADVGPR